MAFMYILECSDKSFYTGSTFDLEKRLYEHNDGKGTFYTKIRRPVTLAYCEEFTSIEEAFHREHQIKKWGHLKKQALLKADWIFLSELSKKKFLHEYGPRVPEGRIERS